MTDAEFACLRLAPVGNLQVLPSAGGMRHFSTPAMNLGYAVCRRKLIFTKNNCYVIARLFRSLG